MTTSEDGYIRLYDRASNLIAKKKAPGGKEPFGVSFSPDGAKIAVGFYDSAKVNVLSGKDLSRLYSPDTGDITDGDMPCVSWSRDGKFLYAGGTAQKLVNEEWKDIIRKWEDEGRGKSNDLVGDFSTVMGIRPIYAGGIVFGSGEPAFGVFDASDRLVVYKRPAIADLRGNWEGFLVSYDGSTVQFGYEIFGKSPAKFSVSERLLELNPGPSGLQILTPPCDISHRIKYHRLGRYLSSEVKRQGIKTGAIRTIPQSRRFLCDDDLSRRSRLACLLV